MSFHPAESKRLLTHTIAEWTCALKYEHLSPEAIQAAKLFWFDSIGCALGGSQQDDAKILLKHYRAMRGGGDGKATTFVSGFKTNPVDAAFLNGHMIRAMDYNDIYWKADPCHPSDLIAAPLALCESEGLGGKDLILATIIAYEIEMRLCEVGRPGVREYGWHHATLSAFAAPVAAGRVLNLTPEQMVSAIGISAARTFCPGAVTAGKLTNMKNTVDPWAGRMGAESALLARRILRTRAHHRWQRRTLCRVQARAIQRRTGHFRWRSVSERPSNFKHLALPNSRLRDEEFPDRGAQSFAAYRHDEDREGTQHQGRRREGN